MMDRGIKVPKPIVEKILRERMRHVYDIRILLAICHFADGNPTASQASPNRLLHQYRPTKRAALHYPARTARLYPPHPYLTHNLRNSR
jgi:hypothetical protein